MPQRLDSSASRLWTLVIGLALALFGVLLTPGSASAAEPNYMYKSIGTRECLAATTAGGVRTDSCDRQDNLQRWTHAWTSAPGALLVKNVRTGKCLTSPLTRIDGDDPYMATCDKYRTSQWWYFGSPSGVTGYTFRSYRTGEVLDGSGPNDRTWPGHVYMSAFDPSNPYERWIR